MHHKKIKLQTNFSHDHRHENLNKTTENTNQECLKNKIFYGQSGVSYGNVRLIQHSNIDQCNSLDQQTKEKNMTIFIDAEKAFLQNSTSMHGNNSEETKKKMYMP